MEDSEDDIPLQVLAETAGWEGTISGERQAFENFSNKGIEPSCPATPLLTSPSGVGRYDVFKKSTGIIEPPDPIQAVADKMQLHGGDSTDQANSNLGAKKSTARKMKILEERKANDIMTCFQRRSGIEAEVPAQGIGVTSSSSSGSGVKRTASGTIVDQSSPTP